MTANGAGMRFLSILFVVLLVCAPAAMAETPFTVRVRACFEQWDIDHDGRLSVEELSRRMLDPSIRGEDAAALATLRFFARKTDKHQPFVCTLPLLAQYEGDVEAHRKTALPLDARYASSLKRIGEACRDLFAAGAPDRDRIRQASGGDCYFLSTVGVMITRDADAVRRLISRNDDGTSTVRLPQGPPVVVADPTDAQIALYTDDTSDGLWLYALQRAYTVNVMARHPKNLDPLSPVESIEHGGTSGVVMGVLTGHRGRLHIVGPNGSDASARWIRTEVPRALAARRLVTVGTPPRSNPIQMPRGVSKQHVMGVLGYDSASDTLTLWNPHGNTIAPGTPGAYPTTHGVFTVPVKDAVRWLRGVTIQESGHPRKNQRGM